MNIKLALNIKIYILKLIFFVLPNKFIILISILLLLILLLIFILAIFLSIFIQFRQIDKGDITNKIDKATIFNIEINRVIILLKSSINHL